jgi:hypothetical protein
MHRPRSADRRRTRKPCHPFLQRRLFRVSSDGRGTYRTRRYSGDQARSGTTPYLSDTSARLSWQMLCFDFERTGTTIGSRSNAGVRSAFESGGRRRGSRTQSRRSRSFSAFSHVWRNPTRRATRCRQRRRTGNGAGERKRALDGSQTAVTGLYIRTQSGGELPSQVEANLHVLRDLLK